MKKHALLAFSVFSAHWAQAQVAQTRSATSGYVGVGLLSLSGYYTGINESASGISFAPLVLGGLNLGPRVVVRGGASHQSRTIDRDESSSQQRFVQHKTTKNLVVPVALQVQLNSAASRFRVAVLGGLTFWHIDLVNDFTYYYYYPNRPEAVVPTKEKEKRLDTLLTGGANVSYQFTPHWMALADVTIHGRIGGQKKIYYEYLPSAGVTLGIGYCLGKAN